VVIGAVLVSAAAGLVAWRAADHARQVTLGQAVARLGGSGGGSPGSGRPAPGVYAYVGSGTEHLSLPPLSQSEGPTIPGTVTLDGARCWVWRIDYSTHHWQTWHYCLHGADLEEAGGQTWQLWSVGPVNVTNLTTFTCAAGSMALPAEGTPGQAWHSHCTGSNTTVPGVTVTSGPYRLAGTGELDVGGTPVPVAHFHRVRTDTGAQTGTEIADVWIDRVDGLPVRLDQQVRVTAATEFGTSVYTQTGTMRLVSLVPRR
jgi:hypothetical protein